MGASIRAAVKVSESRGWKKLWHAVLPIVVAAALGACSGGDAGSESGRAADSASGVDMAAFAANPGGYAHQEVTFDSVLIASRMGAQAFWFELPNKTPYLVKLDPTLVSNGTTIQSGQTVSVTGMVHPMTDSVLTAWEQQGAIADETEKIEAQYATSYIEATRVTPRTGRR